MAPETRKQTEPTASGVHTRRSYDESSKLTWTPRKVVALKAIVPANWMMLLQRSMAGAGHVSRHWRNAAVVKKIEPTKNVSASASAPTSAA